MAQSSVWSSLFGSAKLENKKGEEVSLSQLDDKEYVGLYFSAHWCPPCKHFTPVLGSFYKKHATAKNFEIVFVSSDRDQKAFEDYYRGEMADWLALPYAARELKNELSKKCKVQGIPTFVIFDKTGKIVTTKAREGVSSDPEATSFPWKPKTIWETLAGELITSGGEKKDTLTHLQTTTAFGIYFSAHWCGPCRNFTPKLIQTYNKLKSDGKKFEVVFVSSDKDQHAFDEYYGSMPWAAVPFSDNTRKEELNSLFDVEGIPTFILVDGQTGKVITPNARGKVEADPEGKEFPWHPKPLEKLDEAGSDLNEKACLIFIKPSADELKALEAVAAEYAQKWANVDEKPLLFLQADESSALAPRVASFANLKQPKTLLVLNIPDGNKSVAEGSDFTQASLKEFVEAFLSGSAKKVGLKD